VHAQAHCAVGKDIEQTLSADAVTTASGVQHLLAMDIDNLIELAEGSLVKLLC
jgi:hypothetical protein